MARTTKAQEAFAATFVQVERKAPKKGRKLQEKPGMLALVNGWKNFPVGATIVLPDFVGDSSHTSVSRNRYHWDRKYAPMAGLESGKDYIIESDETHGAVITRLR